MSTLVKNPKAKFDYKILETFEAGLVLFGQEVKSIKKGQMSLRGSYVTIKNEEVWLINSLISPYQPKNTPETYEPTRSRKLLLKKKEIKRLIGKIKQKGLTLVPLRVYTKHEKLKMEFGIGQGKKKNRQKRINKKERNKTKN
ncbi:MAG: SsrA-binding protein SmpB [bacterium]